MLQIINLDPNCSAEEKSPYLANKLYTSQLCSSVVYGTDVTVNVKPTIHTSGSSLVTTKNITSYVWTADKIPGSLIAVHCSGNYFAYAIKGPNGNLVRVINCVNGYRGLVKNIGGVIRDVSFAYLTNQILLACVDQFGSLYVYEIFDETDSMRTELRLQVVDLGADSQRAKWWHESGLQRVVWCPYIPEDSLEEEADEDNFAFMLTVTNGTAAEVWHLGLILSDLDGPVLVEEVKVGYHMITDNCGAITDAAFSPDGSALATSSMDGLVKFFQMKFDTPSVAPRCLHQWNPHDSQPISCLFFLDNHKHPCVDGLWKYAVTGANNNTELKVWSCQNWKCHQTIKFNLCQDSETTSYLSFKAFIDPSSRHIVLSDIYRRVLCIAILNPDQPLVSSKEEDEEEVHDVKFVSISEIPIQMGAISLAINDASFKIYKQWKDESQFSADDEVDDENDMKIVEGLVMQCYLINQKSLQEANIKFQPCLPPEPHKMTPEIINLSSSRDNSISLKDGLTDLSLTMNASTLDSQSNITREEEIVRIFPNSVPDQIQNNGILSPSQALTTPDKNECILSPPPSEALPLNLLTPESFNTIAKEEFDILNEMGLHVGNMENILPGCNSNKDDIAGKKRSLTPVSISKNGITFNSVRKSKSSEEWGSKLNEAVASSPSTCQKASDCRNYNEETEPIIAAPTDLLTPQDTQTVAVSSSTSSPSLEVQQILHNQGGKSDKYMDDADAGSVDEDKMLEEASPVDIMTPFSIDNNQLMANVWDGQPPLLNSPQNIPLLTPDTMSRAKELLGLQAVSDKTSDIFGSSKSADDSNFLQSIIAKSESHTDLNQDQPPPLLGENSQDSQLELFQLQSLPAISNHLTCKQLEEQIKNETPISNITFNWDSATAALPKLIDLPTPSSTNLTDFPEQFTLIQNKLNDVKQALSGGDDKINKQLTLQNSKMESQIEKSKQQHVKLTQITKQIEEINKSLKKVVDSLPNLVAVNIKNGLESSIKKEIKPTMYQATKKSMDTIRSGLELEVRNYFQYLERQTADNIPRLLHSKSFIDSICAGVSSSVSSAIQNSIKECHSKMLVPSFNASTTQMFTQMNDTFSRGTKEYIQHVKEETEAIQITVKDNLATGCQHLDSACTSAEGLAKSLSQNNGMPEIMETRLRSMVREEITKALQEQSALLERQSRAQTPLTGCAQSPFSVKNAQQQLQTYISRQEFNSAFKHALMLSDLTLVVFVCERVNPRQLFSHNPCPLTQEVLLSLINQLSHDLATYTDLKIKYLEEAVMTLDMNHQVTKEHVSQVLGDCQRALNSHLSVNPNQKKLKMLLLAVNQLLSSAV